MSNIIPPNRFDQLTIDGISTERTAAFFEQLTDDLNSLDGQSELFSTGVFSDIYLANISQRVSDLEYQVSDQSSIEFLVRKIDSLEKELAFVESNQREIVRGTIVLWYGATADIPNGWVLCDGNNNTPNLADKFVRGPGAENPGDTGGSNTYSLSVTTSGTSVTTYTPTVTQEVQSGTGINVAANNHVHGSDAHTHDVTDTVDTVPAYYVLAYIMKV